MCPYQQTKTILLINGSKVILKFFSMVAEDKGFSVLTATNGLSALKLAKEKNCELIITDMELLDITGAQFAMAFRDWEKTTKKKSVPIIGLLSPGYSYEMKYFNPGSIIILYSPINYLMLQDILDAFFLKQGAESTKAIEKVMIDILLKDAKNELGKSRIKLIDELIKDRLEYLQNHAENRLEMYKILVSLYDRKRKEQGYDDNLTMLQRQERQRYILVSLRLENYLNNELNYLLKLKDHENVTVKFNQNRPGINDSSQKAA